MAKEIKVTVVLPEDVDARDVDIFLDDANFDAPEVVPTWTSKNGNTKALSDMKQGNLRAIAAKIEDAGLEDDFAGIYNAIQDALFS